MPYMPLMCGEERTTSDGKVITTRPAAREMFTTNTTEQAKKDFRLNGFINHYPDFMVMTKSDVLVLIETKGDHLANDESRGKLLLGRRWQGQVGTSYCYSMVFKDKEFRLDGAYTLDRFVEVMKEL